MNPGVSDKLRKAIAFVNLGDKQQAGRLLAEVLRADPRDQIVWWWMSRAVSTQAARRYCLERALALNPDHQLAGKELAALGPERKKPVRPPETSSSAFASPRVQKGSRLEKAAASVVTAGPPKSTRADHHPAGQFLGWLASPKGLLQIAIVLLIITLALIGRNPGFLTAGQPVGETLTLARGGGLPAVASLPDSGRFLLVWDMGLTTIDGTSLRARFVDALGQPIGEEFAPTSPGGRRGIPSLAANPNAGEFLLTWWDARTDKLGDIYGQRLDTDGRRIGDEFLIAEASNFENWPPAVAYNPVSEEYLVVWYDIRGEPQESSIYARRVTRYGSTIGDVLRIKDQGPTEVRPAVAAHHRTGVYLVVWPRIGEGLEAVLLAQRLTERGEPVGDAFVIGQGDRPSVAYNPTNEEFMVVWANGQAQAARVRGDGSVVQNFPLSEAGNSKNFSDVASAAAEGYLAVWEGPGGDDVLTIVLGREISAGGELVSIQWPLSGASSQNISYPGLAYNAQADVYLVAWEELSQGERLVRGRVYRPGQGPPPPGPPSALLNGDFEAGFYALSTPPFAGQSLPNGWAPYILTGQPSFAGERSTVLGGNWAYKISGSASFDAGLAQVVSVQPGTTYRITAYYQLYPPGDGAAFLGVRDGDGPNQLVGDSWPGLWRPLSHVVTATSDRLTVSLQGVNGADLNTNVYFDDVTVVPITSP